MQELYHQILDNLRSLMARILEPNLDLDDFLKDVAWSAKGLKPEELEARVYEVDFIENILYLRTSTKVDVHSLPESDRIFAIIPHTITGDATIENRVIVATRREGYAESRFKEGQDTRAAFPIEFYDVEMPEGRTKYVLVVDKQGSAPLERHILDALKDFSVLAGLAISIKELRDKLSQYYEKNRNLALSGQHSAAIGHDIRSLNVGVGGYLEMALRLLSRKPGEEKTDKVLDYLEMARDNAAQIEVLLGNFAQFNRREIVLNRDTDLKEAVQTKLESLKNRADFGRMIDFEIFLPDSPTGFMVDQDWFNTVIENIVKNSFEACNSGPTRIRVTLRDFPEQLILSLEDDCGGIPAEIQRDIFTPFRTGKKSGQGLGLANAKKVVDDHGGRIYVTSRQGHGAVFTVEFDRDGCKPRQGGG